MTPDALTDLLAASDPTLRTAPRLPDVRDEVRAALAWDATNPSRTSAPILDGGSGRVVGMGHVATRRRLIVGAVVTAGVAAAIALPLVLPMGSPGAPSAASARALHLLAADVRAYRGPVLNRTTTVGDGIEWVDTRAGRAFFRQQVVATDVTTAVGTTTTNTWGAPRFLTAADERRAQHVVGQPIPSGTKITRQRACTAADKCSPDQAQIAALPTTVAGLNRSIARQDLGGCTGGKGCRAADIISYILAPGVTAATRAAAFDLLATAPGITVLGHRTIEGRRGLAVRTIYGNEGMNLDEIDVFDVHDGSLLANDQYLTRAYDKAEGPLPVPIGTLISRTYRTN